ncbi:hypothetical protein AXG93_3271s1030 [Marchantia polymorpha subsp. ruderalis]|uniref:Uncharacterized protein n=1 Tax=Marchantia polymorpha subsp. ruderalis TaxID=1480154 RepID=A0A176VMR6_MARPO|nr:hypothetical protein AXG93_3271s1030 [Marchantia polymorpha subsp. ruderalis]
MRYSGLLCSALPRGGSAEARRDDERLGTGRGEKGIPVRRSSLTLPNVTEGTEEAHYRKLDIHASRPTQRSPPLPPIQVEGAICRLSSPSFFLSGQASPGRNETETEKQGPSRARGLEWRVAWGVTSLTPPSASDLSATHRRLLRTCVASFRLASLSTVFVNHSFRPPYSLPPLTLLSAKADLLAGSHGEQFRTQLLPLSQRSLQSLAHGPHVLPPCRKQKFPFLELSSQKGTISASFRAPLRLSINRNGSVRESCISLGWVFGEAVLDRCSNLVCNVSGFQTKWVWVVVAKLSRASYNNEFEVQRSGIPLYKKIWNGLSC